MPDPARRSNETPGQTSEPVFISISRTPLIAIVAASYLDRIGFVETIDSALTPDPDQWQVSPGNLAKALVILPFIQYFHQRLPFYDINIYYKQVDMDLLFTPEVRPEWLTPEAFASMLDGLHAAGAGRLFTTLALRVYNAFPIPFDPAIRGETTPFVLWGAFEDGEGGPVRVVLGLACDPSGIPLAATTCYGSEADCIRDPAAIQALAEQNPFTYIADPKMATASNLQGLQEAGFRFAARYPAGLGRKTATRAIRDAYESDAWLQVDINREEPDNYEVQEFTRAIGDGGAEYRLLVFRSSRLRERFESKVSASREEVLSILAGITAKEFARESDAKQALERLRTHRLWMVDLTVEARAPAWIIRAGDPELNQDLYRKELQKAESFVLITNAPAEEMPAQEILRLATEPKIKKDPFSILKHTIAVEPAYLEKPGRSDAFVILFAYTHLIQMLIRVLVRRNLDAMPEPPDLDPVARSSARPGLMRISQILDSYTIITHAGKRSFRETSPKYEENLPIWLTLLDFNVGV